MTTDEQSEFFQERARLARFLGEPNKSVVTPPPYTRAPPAPPPAGDEFADLEEAARGATPGPWQVGHCYKHPESKDRLSCYKVRDSKGDVIGNDNYAYMAAANPARVLDLLAKYAAERAARVRAEGAAEVERKNRIGMNFIMLRNAEIADKAESERDAARAELAEARRQLAGRVPGECNYSGCKVMEAAVDFSTPPGGESPAAQ